MRAPRVFKLWAPWVTTAVVVALLSSLGCREIEEPKVIGAGVGPGVHQPLVDARPLAVEHARPTAALALPDFAAVAREVGPSVVSVISTVSAGGTQLRGIGSGMVVSVHGEILTNEHVVAGAREITVQLPNGSQVAAGVIVADPLLDLALLRVLGEVEGLTPVTFRELDPSPGEWIMAVGQPFGLGDTVTVGVVSGLGRNYADVGSPRDLDPNGIWSFIQTDASINIGNSGGPLVDLEGRVIGITTAVRQDGQGLAFAIPAAMAIRFVDEVRTHRRMRHARLGIGAENDTHIAGFASVVRITRIDPDSPADRAALEIDDLIVAIDGEPITQVSEVAYLSQLAGVGAKITLTIARGEGRHTLQTVIIPEAAN